MSLAKLKLEHAQKRNHSYAVWQKGVKSIGLWSEKFILQKAGYIHMNPVRAGLCEHPSMWDWSSFGAVPPSVKDGVPIIMDKIAYWTEEELDVAEVAVKDRL